MPVYPPALSINDPLVALPSRMFSEPREGRKTITTTIDWSIPLAKNLAAVSYNLQNNATLEFSQICGLIVDNSDCGSDLDFVFMDTNVTISIPAYAPYTVLDVASNQTQFVVVAKGAIVVDRTSFSILNFAPPPVAVPITRMQQNVAVGSIAVTGAGSTVIVPNTTNGTIQGLNITIACPTPSVAFNDAFTLADGSGKALWTGNAAQANSGSGFITSLIDQQGLGLRFRAGLNLVQAGAATPGATLDVNVYYLIP